MAQGIGNFMDRVQIGTDEANQIAIGSSAYAVCSTAANEQIKQVNLPGFTLNTGTTVHIKFTNTNSASNPKLKFNTDADEDAKFIMQYGTTNASTAAETTGWRAGAVLTLTYDGTNWIRDQGYNTNTNTHSYTVQQTASTTSSWRKLLLTGGDAYETSTAAVVDRTAITHQAAGIAAQPSTGTLHATIFEGSGASLTNLNASSINSGTVPFANLPTGTGASQVAVGNHTHGNITNSGALGTASSLVVTNSNKVITTGAAISEAVEIQTQNTKFLREDGTWAKPSYTTNTNDKVTQTGTTSNEELIILLKNTSGTTDETQGVKYGKTTSKLVTINPSTGTITAPGGFAGKATSAGNADTVNNLTVLTAVPANAVFTDTNKYHKTGTWSGLTYTASAVNGAETLDFTIPTGTTSTTVAAGDHNHNTVYITSVSYDSSDKKIYYTKNGSDTDVVTFGSNAFNSTSFLPRSGGNMSGPIKRYYSATSTDPIIMLSANNKDADLFKIGHGTSAGNVSASSYVLRYKGTEASPNNYLQLLAGTSETPSTVAIQIDENGNVSFTNTVTANIDGNAATVNNHTVNSNVPANAVFTDTTSFTITANTTDGLWDLTGQDGTNEVTYSLAPYDSKQATAAFYTAATNPDLTTRLNYDGYFYATKLYSGGTEVLTAHQTYSGFTGKPTENQTPGFGGTFTIQQIKQSTTGAVTGTDWSVTIPNTIATYNALGLVSPAFVTSGSATGMGTAATRSGNVTVNARSNDNGRYYIVEADKDGRLFVNVPWTNVNNSYQTTLTFDGTYNASTNKAATVSTVTSAIEALDVSNITGFGTDQTLATLTETDGKIAATFQTIAFPVTSVNGKTGAITLDDLGLSQALRFVGITTSNMSDGFSNVPEGITNYTTPQVGDVVIDSDEDSEYVCTVANNGTYKWEYLGSDSSWALANHTHTISLTQAGTATVTLAASTVYTLTAGGDSVVFKTPGDNDYRVRQAVTTDTNTYPLLISSRKTTDASNNTAYVAMRNNSIYVQPSSGTVYATTFTGDLTGTASNVTTTEDTTNTLYLIGVTSSATTALKRDTSITIQGDTITATTFSGAVSGNADSATAANITSSKNGIAYYSDTAGTFSSTAAGSDGYILIGKGANTAPTWQEILPVAHGGTGSDLNAFSDNQVVLTQTTNNVMSFTSRAYSDSTSAEALTSSSTNFVTERDVYYGLPTINNAHNYTSSSTLFTPTTAGTQYQILVSNGSNKAPVWTGAATLQSGLGTTSAAGITTLTLGNNISTGTKNNSSGKIILYSSGAIAHSIIGANKTPATSYTHTLPLYEGWIASGDENGVATDGKTIMYLNNSGILTACNNVTVGSSTQPIYLLNGQLTALEYTENVLYYSASTTSFAATGHYASSSRIGINDDTWPSSYNAANDVFYVNGNSYFNGKINILNTTQAATTGNGTGALIVAGGAYIGSNLLVTNDASFGGNLSTSGNLSATGNLSVTGMSTLTSNVSIGDTASASEDHILSIKGSTVIKNTSGTAVAHLDLDNTDHILIFPETNSDGGIGQSSNRWKYGYFAKTIDINDTHSSITLELTATPAENPTTYNAVVTLNGTSPYIDLQTAASGASDWKFQNTGGVLYFKIDDTALLINNEYGTRLSGGSLYIDNDNSTITSAEHTALDLYVAGKTELCDKVGIGIAPDSSYKVNINGGVQVTGNIDPSATASATINYSLGSSSRQWYDAHLYHNLNISQSTASIDLLISTSGNTVTPSLTMTATDPIITLTSGSSSWSIDNNAGIFKLTDSNNNILYGDSGNNKGFYISSHLYINPTLSNGALPNNTYNLYINGTTYHTDNITFKSAATSPKLCWSGASDSAEIYYTASTGNNAHGELILNTQDSSCLITYANAGDKAMYMDTSSTPSFYPASTGQGSLGLSNKLWGAVYIGTQTSYGDAYTPIYWNSGVPTAVMPIQFVEFTIGSGDTGVTLSHAAFTVKSYVLQIVVTTGSESYLTGPISWRSYSPNTANNETMGKIELRCAQTTGAVSGYILVSRGDALDNVTSAAISSSNT